VKTVSIYGRQRLRGTASPPSLHRSSWPRTDWPLLADALEGVRSVGAVKTVWLSAHRGCEGPQPSRTPPIIVATNGWVIAGRFPRAKGGHFFAAFQCPCTDNIASQEVTRAARIILRQVLCERSESLQIRSCHTQDCYYALLRFLAEE
jgi:hypothetical protein